MTAFKVTQVTLNLNLFLYLMKLKKMKSNWGGGRDKKLPLKQNLEQALNKKIVVLPIKQQTLFKKILLKLLDKTPI